MLLDYYKLREQPFGVTPDPRFFYAGFSHREALASLLYGIEARRGFLALIARPGMGKTTLLFHGLQRLQKRARTVFLFQAMPTPEDLLRALLADLGVRETEGSLVKLQSTLNDLLAEQFRSGKPLVLVIDEAQNLDDSVLELVRMLSNFETSREKLMQIVLSGQPQLAEKLASPDLIQLRQRISIFAHLKPFSPEETARYMDQRLRTAGYTSDEPLFTPPAVSLIAEHSEGIPRNINNLCFNALSLGCALKRKTIDCDIVREVLADLDLEPLQARSSIAWPHREDAQEPSALVSAASLTPILADRLKKIAFASATILTLGCALYVSHAVSRPASHPVSYPSMAPQAAGQTNNMTPAPAAADPSSFDVAQGDQPAAPAGAIRVTRGQTLYRICVEHFGNCSSQRLQEFHRLNPWLNNPDHIESGQRIRIPDVPKLSEAPQSTVKQPGKA